MHSSDNEESWAIPSQHIWRYHTLFMQPGSPATGQKPSLFQPSLISNNMSNLDTRITCCCKKNHLVQWYLQQKGLRDMLSSECAWMFSFTFWDNPSLATGIWSNNIQQIWDQLWDMIPRTIPTPKAWLARASWSSRRQIYTSHSALAVTYWAVLDS